MDAHGCSTSFSRKLCRWRCSGDSKNPYPDLSRTARSPQIKILPDDSPACLGSFLFRLTRNKAGATELVPLLIATDCYGWPLMATDGH
jgi:hypothetical protein